VGADARRERDVHAAVHRLEVHRAGADGAHGRGDGAVDRAGTGFAARRLDVDRAVDAVRLDRAGQAGGLDVAVDRVAVEPDAARQVDGEVHLDVVVAVVEARVAAAAAAAAVAGVDHADLHAVAAFHGLDAHFVRIAAAAALRGRHLDLGALGGVGGDVTDDAV